MASSGSGSLIITDAEDLVVAVKTCAGAELDGALSAIPEFLSRRRQLREVEEAALVRALLGRLSSPNGGRRASILAALRRLAAAGGANKERMGSADALSAVVRSLSRDAEERQEAVALLSELSDVPAIRQRIGKVKGSVVMLVALRNGGEPHAGRLLSSLSGNAQNVLLMAEAGHFPPLLRCLQEGSDTSRMLMASCIARMPLSEKAASALGAGGAVESLAEMLGSGGLECKTSALGALRSLSRGSPENRERMIGAGAAESLLELLFSVTSAVTGLKDPASALLSDLAQSGGMGRRSNVGRKMVSLLGISPPEVQMNLLRALESVVRQPDAAEVRAEVRRSGVAQLVIPFLAGFSSGIRAAALSVLFSLSADAEPEFAGEVVELHVPLLLRIVGATESESEMAAAVGILSNIPAGDSAVTAALAKAKLLPLLVSLLMAPGAASPARAMLLEGIAGVLVRFTVPEDKKLQRAAAAQGIVPCLVRLLSAESATATATAKCRAATALAQLSMNTHSLCSEQRRRWRWRPPQSGGCGVHGGQCGVKTTFCLVKAGAVGPLLKALRCSRGGALRALATLLGDETWEGGCRAVDAAGGVPALLRAVAETEEEEERETAMWMLERVFRLEECRERHGGAAQLLLVGLAQGGDGGLTPMAGKILAHLELLQPQSSYF